MMTKKGVAGIDKTLKVAVPRCSKTSPSHDPLIQNYSNFKRSSEPKRVMFYDDRSWADYPEAVLEVMKLGFSEGRPIIEARIEGLDRLLDFYRMLEIELGSGNQRSISWIDVDGKCFFPKIFVNTYDDNDADFVDCEENNPKIEIEIKLSKYLGSSESLNSLDFVEKGNLCERKREEQADIDQPEESSSNVKVKRRQIVRENELQSPRWPKTRVLRAEEEGYVLVKNLFLTGLKIVEPGAKVTVINQCVRTAPLDVARQVFMKQMEITKEARGASNMVFAWYGTSAEGVESILMHGFRRPAMESRFQGHGMGINLSPVRSPQNSALLSEMDENGEKHVILCKVILGRCEKIDAGSRQSHPSGVDYDTGVDDLTSPKWYTVWCANINTHIIPECVVSYRPGDVPGSVNGVSNVNWVPPARLIAKLLCKMQSYLPMPKLQELRTLCGLCKEGKLGKNGFMQQLRTVIGDDLLRSTIQEICG